MIAGMTERQKLVLFAVMALGNFMALLDIQIVASSVSEIQAGLGAAPDESSWIQTAYLMAEIVMIPFSGWLSRAFSTRWLFTCSAIGFTIASIACGFARNIETMIAARALQGFLGGAMVPTVFATGFALFPGKKQAIVPAVLGILSTLAPTIGPTLGGWITETYSWHWLFFINLVPGLIIICAIPVIGRVDEPDLPLLRHFDAPGLALLIVFLASLEYVLEEGYRWNWFDDPTILKLAWLSGVAGLLFVVRMLTQAQPIVDLRALRNRTFAIACFFNFVTGFGIFGAVYILPLFLAHVRGFNAEQIGAAVWVGGISMILSTPLVAGLSRKVDPRIMLGYGLGAFALGLWMLTPITSEWSGGEMFWAQIVRGSAMMFCIVPATNLALGSLPPERLKMSSALFTTSRNLGGAVGIACVNTWLNDRTNLHWLRLCEHLNSANTVATAWLQQVAGHMAAVSTDPASAQEKALALLAQVTRREAATLAYSDALWFMAMLFLGALVFVPLVKRPHPPTAAARSAAH